VNDRSQELLATASSYAGRTRYTTLEYEAVLANASIGVAFTRDRKFFLCNPKFAEMFGWSPDELIGQPGEVVYPSQENYVALGQIAVPILSAGRQLDLEWEVQRRDGSKFLARMIAKAINPEQTQQGTVWIVEDITDRKRQADEVTRLVREQEAILDTTPIGICFVRDRRIVRTNRRFEELHGYGPGELVGQPTAVTYANDADYERVGEGYSRLGHGASYTSISESRRKDGSTYWSRVTGRAVDPADPAKGSVWVDEDISEQKRAEEDLARLLGEQQALLNNVVVGISFVRDRVIQRCNRRFEELFGYASGEALGASARQLYFTDEEFVRGAKAYEDLHAGRLHSREQWLRRNDGTGFWCRISGRSVDTANPEKGTVWLFEDVSERKRADESVQRLLKEQNALLDSSTIGIAFLKDRRVMRCNRRFEELFGYAQGELLNQSTLGLHAEPADFTAAEESYEKVWAGETQQAERRMKRKDGTEFRCHLSGRAVQPGDPAQGSVWTFDDVTAERESEARIRAALNEQALILDNATVGIGFVRDHVIQRCNQRLLEMTGLTEAEVIGKSTEVLHVDHQEWKSNGERAYASTPPGGTFSGEAPYRRAGGGSFLGHAVGRRLDTGSAEQEWIWIIDDVTAEREAAEQLQRALAEQQLVLDNVTVGVAFVRNRIIQRVNRVLAEMTGRRLEDLVGQSSEMLFAEKEDWERAGDLAFGPTPPGGNHTSEWRFKRADGSTFLCRTRGHRIATEAGAQHWIWSYDDVTAEREAEAQLKRSLSEQQLVLDNATVGIAYQRNRMFQRVNPRLAAMFGYSPDELVGTKVATLFASQDAFDAALAVTREPLMRGESCTHEWELRRKDGGTLWCRVVLKAIDPRDIGVGTIWIYDDVTAERATRESLTASRDELERAVAARTAELKSANDRLQLEIGERKQAEDRAQHLADHDALTGLPNRRLLEDRLTQALALSYRNRKQTAVMFVDLDRFKTVNDSLGHAAGDVLLKEVSVRLGKQLRVGDTICRVGGDEFVIVLPEIKRSSDAANVAQKVIEGLSLPIRVEDRDLTVTPSIGISVFPDDGRDAETLIRNADAAMYHAKESGRCNYQFFTDQMNLAASRRLALENDLRRALQKGELMVHYQPITEMKTGGFVAVHEALLRWKHPTKGIVPPVEFIQLAEDTGLILQIGEWVLREACRWGTFIGGERGPRIAVNLSARQFGDPRLVEMVARVLKETGLPAKQLELEITESTVMQQMDVTLATLNRLKELGVSIAIDDFGTGYSSLAYLKRFPVDKLKIDKSFIADVPADKDGSAIVAAILGLAHALGLTVCAEGVETEAQMEFLQQYGCDLIQGYLIGRPVDGDTAAKEYV
jgi:diguanylate cyclase (GGDEF)-like protein/PAS domain S-box-containing protein